MNPLPEDPMGQQKAQKAQYDREYRTRNLAKLKELAAVRRERARDEYCGWSKAATRFWSLVPEMPADGCWLWRGPTKPSGYGTFNALGLAAVAHRVAYELSQGPIPAGLEIDHLCRNRACVRPDHLEPVTHQENVRRAPKHPGSWQRRLTHCKRGHPFTEDNIYRLGNVRHCRECRRESAASYRQRQKGEAA